MKALRFVFPLIMASLSLVGCATSYNETITRDFSAEEIKSISINVDSKKDGNTVHDYFHFYDAELINEVYKEFSYEKVNNKELTNYKTDIEDCLYIWNVSFTVKTSCDDVLIVCENTYYVYSKTEGTVSYLFGPAYKFDARGKGGDLLDKISGLHMQQVRNKEFAISVTADEYHYFNKPTGNNLNVQIYQPIMMGILIPDELWVIGEDNTKLISIRKSDKIDILFGSANDYGKSILYTIYAMEKFANEELVVTFNNTDYILNISSIDYDFTGTSIPSTNDLEGDYSSFKEMMDSIAYHEFVSPYPGRDPSGSYGGSSYWNIYTYTRRFDEQYDTSYASYLTDSIYYPTKMDMAWENVGDRHMSMTYIEQNSIETGANKSVIPNFIVEYSVIDPDCTQPTNGLGFMTFQAFPKNLTTISSKANEGIDRNLHNTYYLLSKEYPEQYCHYESSGLDISIIKYGDRLNAYFEDDTYVYSLSCGLLSNIIHIAV